MSRRIQVGLVFGAVLLVVIVALTIAYFWFGVFRSDRAVDLWLLVAWALVVVVWAYVLYTRVKTREELVRRFYLSNMGAYNHELGYVSFRQAAPDNDAFQFVSFAADSLAIMSYGFDVAEAPWDFEPRYVITTSVLHYHLLDDDEDAGAVVDRWEGTLLRVVTPGDESSYEKLGTYRNARELSLLLEEEGVFL